MRVKFIKKTPYFTYRNRRIVNLWQNEIPAEVEKIPMTSDNPELQELLDKLHEPITKESYEWLADFSEKSMDVPDGEGTVILNEWLLNYQRYLNRYFIEINKKLKTGGYFVCCFNSSVKRRQMFYDKYPLWIANILYFFDFLWHRVCPKLLLTKKFYFWIYKKVKRVYPRVEIIGRLYFCGFEVFKEGYINGFYFIITRKIKEPCEDPKPSYSMLIRLKRVGKNGKLIDVFKFRTMYAYSEYLQDYIYKQHYLDKGGKFADDYRISGWGKVLRKYWIDEIPMIINLLKGDLKLVGVRPLSKQYFDLYTPEMQQLRIKVKPGLMPPFYADMPETLEEIQESERKYIEAYLKHPFRTDWKYFWMIMKNIFVKKKRSK